MIENYLQRRPLTTYFFGSQFKTMAVTNKAWKQYPDWITWYLLQFFFSNTGKKFDKPGELTNPSKLGHSQGYWEAWEICNIFMFCTISGCARSLMMSKPASRYAQKKCYNQICLKLLLCHNTLLVPEILPYHYNIVSFFLISWGCSYVFLKKIWQLHEKVPIINMNRNVLYIIPKTLSFFLQILTNQSMTGCIFF